MEKLISVIVPVYNVHQYLRLCINSILRQSYANLEIILVDDGSTDGSEYLCEELKSVDDRIIVFHKDNGGLSDARNFGIKCSTGAFLSFIDSDDVLHKDFFLTLMKVQEQTNADIVAGEISVFYDHNELQNLNKIRANNEFDLFVGSNALIEYFKCCGSKRLYHGVCMKIYKKEIFNGLEFEKNKLHEDVYITYQLLNRARKVALSSSPLYFYYQNNMNSICKNYGSKNFLDEVEAYERMYNYFALNNRISEELIRFIVVRYVNILSNIYEERNSPEIIDTVNKVKKWICSHICESSCFTWKEYFAAWLTVNDIYLLSYYRKIKDIL